MAVLIKRHIIYVYVYNDRVGMFHWVDGVTCYSLMNPGFCHNILIDASGYSIDAMGVLGTIVYYVMTVTLAEVLCFTLTGCCWNTSISDRVFMGPVRQEGSSATSTQKTLNELRAAPTEERQRIRQMTINRIVASMRRRCVAVINNRAGFTRY